MACSGRGRTAMSAPGDDVAEAGARAPTRRRSGGVIAVAGVLAVLLLTATVFFRWGSSHASPQILPTATPKPTVTKELSATEVYSQVAPSVVTIEALEKAGGRVAAIGTGVIANSDGVI